MPEWFIPAATLAGTLLAAVWSLAWWLSRQFANMRNLVYEKIEKLQAAILDKLEYHERHDDARFQAIQNDLWAIRIRNAARDGINIDNRPNTN